MNITILSYFDQALVDQVNARVAERAALAKAAAEKLSQQQSSSTENDFSSVLNDAVQASGSTAQGTTTASATTCPSDLYEIFEEAAATYNVPVKLLTSIARAESGFNANAVSSAGAIGIMQLMPETAAALGVTNSYDPRENIMGGAKYIAQLLEKYNGNVSLALAAYNAGSNNVDKYGGIPPFTETQNYVQKVLSYLNADLVTNSQTAAGTTADIGTNTDTTRVQAKEATDAIVRVLESDNLNSETLSHIAHLLEDTLPRKRHSETETTDSSSDSSDSVTQSQRLTMTVVDGSRILNPNRLLSVTGITL